MSTKTKPDLWPALKRAQIAHDLLHQLPTETEARYNNALCMLTTAAGALRQVGMPDEAILETVSACLAIADALGDRGGALVSEDERLCRCNHQRAKHRGSYGDCWCGCARFQVRHTETAEVYSPRGVESRQFTTPMQVATLVLSSPDLEVMIDHELVDGVLYVRVERVP